jgi:hypothetical protein
MKTKKILKKLGLGLGFGVLMTTELSAAVTPVTPITVTTPTTEGLNAAKTFCAAVGDTGAMEATGTTVVTVCAFSNLAGWVSFVKGGALIGTLYFGYKGSGIGDGDTFDIKKIVMAGGLAAISLQYAGIMTMIAGFFV